jgi:diguanylate cyclase (GGDEF)-like protein/PAS domain S-box-containing protein
MPDVSLKLLVIDPSREDTESYVSTLRNAGMAAHAERIDREEDLLEALKDPDLEMILCSDQAEQIKLLQALQICHTNRPELPFLVIYQNEEPATLIAAMRQGARDIIAREDPEHMQLVVAREHENLQSRRELAELKQDLKEAEERCASLIESSQNAIAYVYEGMHIQANPRYLNLFGYVEMDDIEGLPIMDMVVPDDHARFKEFLRSLNGDFETADIDVSCKTSDGSIFQASLQFSPANIDGEPCTQIIISNQSSQKDLEKRIQMLSLRDAETGLYSRQFIMQRLEEVIEQSHDMGGNWALLYIIIDAFKEIRSNVGLTTSDLILKEVAAALESATAEGAILARFGDHSFALLHRYESDTEVEALASTLGTVISDYVFEGSEQLINPTCSIGVAHSPGENSSQDFINHAYFACESAREQGGNQASTYDDTAALPGYQEDGAQPAQKGSESDIQELLRHALENDRLRLVYQPVVSLQGDTRENYAVLSRLLDKNDEEILPRYFLEEAEQSGQLITLDRWVINHAIQELAQQRNEGRKVNFFITLSGAAIADEGTLLYICDCLRDHKAKGAWLTFQLSDADLRVHAQAGKKLVEGLKKIKCQIAITHFGITPKGETLLKHFEVDFVKLHSSFMENLATTPDQQKLLTATNEMIHSHDVKTIATGVEDANSLAILWTAGINYIQGYFLQEPSESISYDFNSPS